MKNEEVLSTLDPLCPADFFSLHMHAFPEHRKKTFLPDTSELLGEERFAKLSLTWSAEGLQVYVLVEKAIGKSFYPDFRKGDSLELFVDTRDMKTACAPGRFSHHFLILPQAVGEIDHLEITRFRSEDSHPLCDPDELYVKRRFKKTSYEMEVKIPTTCLFGYDPASVQRLGFTYQINRERGAPQHLSLSSKDYVIENHPRLWASVLLKE